MTCGRKIFKLIDIFFLVFLFAGFCCAQTLDEASFEELYDDSTDFYGDELYSKIHSRSSVDGKSWTVLFFDAGLDLSGGHSDYAMFREIASKVTSARLRFLVQTRNSKGNFVRYRLNRGTVASLMEKKSLGTMSESLSSFIQWAKKSYAGDRTALVIRGLPSSVSNAVCHDGFSLDPLTVKDLARSLSDAGLDLDLVVFDTGLSSNIETGYAIAPYARYMLGSQEILPPDAFDYSSMAEFLSSDISASAMDLGMDMLDRYVEKLSGGENLSRHSMALVDLAKMGAVFSSFTRAADSMDLAATSIETFSAMSRAFSLAWEFGRHSDSAHTNMLDLADFAILASDGIGDSSTSLLDALYDSIVYESHGENLSGASGLSFWYPKSIIKNQKSVLKKEMDSYSEIFGCGPYLAYLDAALDSWAAPSWVHSLRQSESGKVPCLRHFFAEKSSMHPVSFSEGASDDGDFSIKIVSGSEALSSVDFRALYMEEKTGAVIRMESLGKVDFDDSESMYGSTFSGEMLSLDGHPVWAECLESNENRRFYYTLVVCNGCYAGLLISQNTVDGSFKIEGLYPRYSLDGTIGREKRNLEDGDLVEFVFPAQFGVDLDEVMAPYGSTVYTSSSVVEKSALPDGFYVCFFTVADIFGNRYESIGKSILVEGGQIVDGSQR